MYYCSQLLDTALLQNVEFAFNISELQNIDRLTDPKLVNFMIYEVKVLLDLPLHDKQE